MSIYRDERITKSLLGESLQMESSAHLSLFVVAEQNLRRVI